MRIYTWICVFRLTTHKIFHSFCCFAICRSCHLLREIYRFLMQNHAWNVLMFQSDSNKDISVRFSCYILRHICILYLYYWIFYNRFYICFLRRQASKQGMKLRTEASKGQTTQIMLKFSISIQIFLDRRRTYYYY